MQTCTGLQQLVCRLQHSCRKLSGLFWFHWVRFLFELLPEKGALTEHAVAHIADGTDSMLIIT